MHVFERPLIKVEVILTIIHRSQLIGMMETFALALPLVAGKRTAPPSLSLCQTPHPLPLSTWSPGTRWHSHHHPFPQQSPKQLKPTGARSRPGRSTVVSSEQPSFKRTPAQPCGGWLLETEGKTWGAGLEDRLSAS